MADIRRKYRATLILLLILVWSCGQRGKAFELRKATSNDILLTIASHRGEEAVLVNFWASWCKPCVEEFPMIVDLDRHFHRKGLKTYFVNVDFLDELPAVRRFLSDHQVLGLTFVKNEDDNTFIDGIGAEWSGALPFTIVYGKQSGDVVDSWEGKVKQERFEQAIVKALEQ